LLAPCGVWSERFVDFFLKGRVDWIYRQCIGLEDGKREMSVALSYDLFSGYQDRLVKGGYDG